jgi:5-methylthioadenosine/S-adenosylhomocysteine deaminase
MIETVWCISIDIVSSIAGDMFGGVRMLPAGTRAVVNQAGLRQNSIVDWLPMMSRDVLQFATVQGARLRPSGADRLAHARQGG